MTRPIFLVAGGTGGHVFPAAATADALKKRGANVVFLTDQRGKVYFSPMDDHVVTLSAATPTGRSGIKRWLAYAGVLWAMLQSFLVFVRFRPMLVVGFGGYPSFAPCKAAQIMGIPTVLHEQNAVLGRANRSLFSSAHALAVSFEDTIGLTTREKIHVTGNPVRYTPIPKSRQTKGALTLSIFAGSQGAQFFGLPLAQCLLPLLEPFSAKLFVNHQVRSEDCADVIKLYQKYNIRADIAPFFDDLPQRLHDTDFAICRSGASTVAELANHQVPALLIPLPGGLDAQQAENAQLLMASGGARLIEQDQVQTKTLEANLHDWLNDPSSLHAASEALSGLARPSAADDLADVIFATIRMSHE
ncbi:MAG: UDP-N-acetylglucosamine--N-acetylmuramyl-(pentapeptide) pyrophosphoryl-undecaprenol N-acetylglucosamine transferase [Alphaproteobacteria bacterium]|nr:UDP-N-acetylglucosamine--N-acetylmuramyl-(pentapeptide) pyrophosphoryl-undecaprenol N-acetylglucosamine transferase [Alphaproteobacteria bacterium]